MIILRLLSKIRFDIKMLRAHLVRVLKWTLTLVTITYIIIDFIKKYTNRSSL